MSSTSSGIKSILDGATAMPSGDDLKSLIDDLQKEFKFGLARELLTKARTVEPSNVWIVQQLALCTYKDEELQPDHRFKNALLLLETVGLRNVEADTDTDTRPETLGLGGAIYKRKWEHDGQLENLHESLYFYRAAWQFNKQKDMGYGGVNAAYVLDILESRARLISTRTGIESTEADALHQQSQELREEILDILAKAAKKNPDLKNQDWFLVTQAEVHFGLKQYAEAGELLKQVLDQVQGSERGEWKVETTFRQLVSLARLQGCVPPEEGAEMSGWHPAWQALHAFLKDDTERALSCYRGKLGLALSGGGFRASLFHIGVLARLAEMDVLRHVEVLSTVSGGSIVGAHYYLEVQHLLQTREDRDITREDYREIVQRVLKRFVDGVQKNLRTRTLSDFFCNLRMIFSKEYSRSHRLGELYEKHLYGKIGPENNLAQQSEPRSMSQLLITPLENGKQNKTFNPKFSNWRRRAKAPILVLNSTSLNSGHAWHFTARWMGEPPGMVGAEVDVNERYRRLWYEQASKPEHKNYRMGYAVAASSCVPGLFEPLALEGLYPDRTVKLVDGGVHDNQGVAGLLNEGCSLILCSDASGQMDDKKEPADGVLSVPLRANSILMDRVREAEYQDLQARVNSGALNGLFFIHMKKGLGTPPIDWDKQRENPTTPPEKPSGNTDYNVDKDLQHKLAALRTDLDSFTDVEAHSLMLSGYLMADTQFQHLDQQHQQDKEPGRWGDFDIDAAKSAWPFKQLETLLSQPPENSDVRRADLGEQLQAGSGLFFKIWTLSPILRKQLKIGCVVALGLLALAIYWFWGTTFSFSVGGLIVFLGLSLLGILVPVIKWLNPQEATRGYFNKVVVSFLGYALTNIHLKFFDKKFLERGNLENLLNRK